jgi:hypothetical protein
MQVSRWSHTDSPDDAARQYGNVRSVVLGMGEADRDFVSNLCHYHGYRFCDVVVALELASLLLASRRTASLAGPLASAKPSTAATIRRADPF